MRSMVLLVHLSLMCALCLSKVSVVTVSGDVDAVTVRLQFKSGELQHRVYTKLCAKLGMDSITYSVSSGPWLYSLWGDPSMHVPAGLRLSAVSSGSSMNLSQWDLLAYAVDSITGAPFSLMETSNSHPAGSYVAQVPSSPLSTVLSLFITPIAESSLMQSFRGDRSLMDAVHGRKEHTMSHVSAYSGTVVHSINETAVQGLMARFVLCSAVLRSATLSAEFPDIPNTDTLFESMDTSYVSIHVLASQSSVTFTLQYIARSFGDRSRSERRVDSPILLTAAVAGTGQPAGSLLYFIRCSPYFVAPHFRLNVSYPLVVSKLGAIDYDTDVNRIAVRDAVFDRVDNSASGKLLIYVSLQQCVRPATVEIPFRKWSLAVEQYGPEAHHGFEQPPAFFLGRWSAPIAILGLRPDPSFIYNTFLMWFAMVCIFLMATYNTIAERHSRRVGQKERETPTTDAPDSAKKNQ
eukprot:ANDGO_00087.mRNA.1 hypothetical protein